MNYKDLNPEAFKKAMAENDNVVLLDVRTPGEVAQGKIEGAVAIDFFADDFQTQVSALDKDKNYFVYCRSGQRSGQACQLMHQLGFQSLVNLEGGILAWNA
ncbi:MULTISPECIES: rhodanese-like domain-containing protein [unclassified Aureispira]|uniref:rhodanese-like domain-containing protein n=1 Tax=unclassified Aureispira TaxID=2649989 RepID=UPI00069901B5|nr:MULTISPECIES: rhodanese-like domain-containing protein [unclassified Aureispira]WMX16357.1 rhodanese-like domain-containing protein [Aureispira sp. CCB-E]